MTARPENDPPAPYVGLRPFEFHEAALFYGRGEHIAEMVRTLRKGHFLAVVGSSGSGKSSLVRAGLLPAIAAGFMNGGEEAADWRFVIMRPGLDPYENLLRELLPKLASGQSLDPQLIEFRRQTLRGGPRGLVEAVADSLLPEPARLVVLVDQFEEIFRFLERGGPSQPDDGSSLADRRNAALAFVDMLLATTPERDPHVYVVLTMRSEYLGECEAFLGLSAAIAKSQFLTPRMTREQIQDIIERPIEAVGGRIEPQVVTNLLNSLGPAQDQLPRVEHILLRMWNRAREAREKQSGPDQPVSLTVDDYRAAGGFESGLDQHAEQLYRELGPGANTDKPSEKQRVAEHLFRSLAVRSSQGTLVRRLSSLGEVASIAGASEQIVAGVVEHFRQSGCHFLVATPSAPLTGKTTLDISHEALLRQWNRLRSWIEKEAKSAEEYRLLAGKASRWNEIDAVGLRGADLLQGRELERALEWKQEQNPTAVWAERYHPGFTDAMDYLGQSRQAEVEKTRRERNARRTLRVGVVATLVILVGISSLALYNMFEARKEKTKASLHEKAALVNALLPNDPLKALVLAIQATGESKSELGEVLPRVNSSLLNAIQAAEWLNFFNAHEGAVTSIAISAEGQTIVSGGDDGTVRLWDRAGKPIGAPLTGHRRWVTSVAISPDGQTIVSGGDDGTVRFGGGNGTVRLWDRAGKPIGAPWKGHKGNVTSVAISADGQTIVSGGEDGTVQLWDRAGKPIGAPLTGHKGNVTSVAISPDGQTIVSGGEDGTVQLWDRAGKPIGAPLTGHKGNVTSVAISPDGQTIVSGGSNGTVRLWDRVGKPIGAPLTGHRSWVTSVAISPDGQTIVSGGDDGTVRLWDRVGKPIGEPLTGHKGNVTSVAISPDGQTIVSGGGNGTLSLWALKNDTKGKLLTWYGKGDEKDKNDEKGKDNNQAVTSSIAISPDGQTIVSGGDDGTVRLWDREGTPIGKRWKGHKGKVTSVAISPDGQTIVSGGDDGTVRLWDRVGKPIGEPLTVSGSDYLISVAITPDGKAIVSGSDEGNVWVWDREGTPIGKRLTGHKGNVTSVAISPDGQTIVSGGGDDGTVRLWDRAGKPIGAPLTGHKGNVTSVAISPDGQTIVSGGEDGTVRLWFCKDNCEDSANIKKSILRGHDKKVTSFAFSSDGQYIVSGSVDASVRLWDRNGIPMGKPFKGKTNDKTGGDSKTTAVTEGDLINLTIVAFSPKAHDIVMVSGENKNVSRWPVGEPGTWLREACEKVRNHEVLFESGNEIADEIDEEAGKKTVQNAVAICLEHFQRLGLKSQISEFEFRRRLARGRTRVRNGLQLAQKGDIERAIAAFQDAQKLDPEIDLDPRTRPIEKDPRAIAQKLAAPARVNDGRRLAQQGDIEGAIAAFQDAQKLDPEIDLDPRTRNTTKNDPKAVARKLAAPARVNDGRRLAQKGDIEGAIAAFQEAQKLDPEIDLDPKAISIEKDPRAVAQKLAVRARVDDGQRLAQQGHIEGAIAAFQEARKLDPEIDLDPRTKAVEKDPRAVAQKLAALARVNEGRRLVQQGHIEGVIAAFQDAQKLDPSLETDWEFWNNVGWYLSLSGHAAEALKASEKAVKFATLDRTKKEGLAMAQDTRGLARALTGDKQGAIKDFEAFIGSNFLPTLNDERQQWVVALRKGQNPFTPEVLEKLRTQ